MRYARLSAQVDGTEYLVEHKVSAHPIVVGGVIRQQMAEVPFPQDHDMVEALASDRADQPFNMTVLPQRAWRDRPVANAHGLQPPGDRGAMRGVAVTDEVARCLIPWECFGDLPGDPLGGWICCHIGPDEPSPLQTQDDQPVEQFEPDRRNDEQIDAGDVGGVIAQEGLPARGARAVTSVTYAWRQSTGRCRYQVSAARHECVAHPTAGCRG